MLKKILPFFIIYISVIILYYPALSTYFSNDDFFHFKVSITDGSLKSFIRLFGFYPFDSRGIAFYRPIFREVLYSSFYSLFGLSSLPFRIFQFIIHFINIYLLYKLVQNIYRNKFVSFFAAFFFAICSANVASFYYLAGGIQTQGATMFILLTLLLFEKYPILSFITFLGAISSHELAVTIPLLLTGLIFINHKFKDGLKRVLALWPYFMVVGIYLFINLKIIGYSSNETQYQLDISSKTTLNTLSWYSGWALGLPETLIDFVNPGFKLNSSLMRFWGGYYKIIFTSFFISLLIIGFYITKIITTSNKIHKDKRFWFFTIWFPLALIPVLFLPQHKSTYYLYPALPGFWTAITVIAYDGFVSTNKMYPMLAKISLTILAISLFLLSGTSAILARSTYWAVGRGRLAEKIIKDIKTKYPALPKGSILYFKNDPTYPFISREWKGSSNQAYLALNDEDAMRLVYNDQTIRVFYEDRGGLPIDIQSEKVISIVAIY